VNPNSLLYPLVHSNGFAYRI